MIYEATVRAIIEQAMTAPSGDNCQPWTWVWDGQVLFINHSSERGRHSINLNNSASLLSFGCLLEALEIASTSFGYKSKVTLVNPGSSDPTAAWARVEFTESVSAHGVVQAHPHYQTLEMRATDRRPYKGGSVNDPVFSEIARITKDSSKARVLVKSSDSKEFMDYALNSEYFLWTAKKVVKDLCHWMRLTSHEAASTQDGMSAQNMNINPMEASMMKLVRRYPIIPKILWHLGFKFKMKSLMKQNIQSSAALICVAVKDMSEAAIIEAGKLAMKTWLTLNKNGYGVQPLTFLSLTATNIEVGAVGAPTEGNFIKHFKKGKAILAKIFNLQNQELPLWVFRTGLADNLPLEMKTKRLSVNDMLTIRKSRQWARIPVSMNGEFVGKYNSTPVRVRDISKGGAGIQISKPLAGGTELLKGEVVDTKIDFNNGTIVTIKARVAWTMSDAVSQVQVCGLEVIEPVQAWRAAVDNFVPETTQKPKVVIPVH